MKGNTDPWIATSLVHGLDLLEAFVDPVDGIGPGDRTDGLTNAELALRSGLSRASVSRLTTTLATRGLVESDPHTGRYRLGPTALRLAYPFLVRLALRLRARLPMKALADETGATVSLGLIDRWRMVCVEVIPGERDRASGGPGGLEVGSTLPLLTSAMGRAWLASATDVEVAHALGSAPLLAMVAAGRKAGVLAGRGNTFHAGMHAERGDGTRARSRTRTGTSDVAAGVATTTGIVSQAREALARQGYCLSSNNGSPGWSSIAIPIGTGDVEARLILHCRVATRPGAGGPPLQRLASRMRALADRLAQELEAGEPATGLMAGDALPDLWRPASDSSTSGRAPDPLSDRQFARTLARGLDLLLAFSPNEPEIGNRALARRLSLPPSTIARLTHTLTSRGYLAQRDDRARFRLGPAAVTLTRPMLSHLPVRRIARPHLLALADRFGAAVSVGLRHQTHMIYVETAWRTDGRLLPPDIGAPMPILRTAMGRAWLGAATARERTRVLNSLRVIDPEEFAAGIDAARGSIDDFARRGYSRSRDFRPEIEAIAVPFSRAVEGQPAFVLNCGVLAPRPLTRRAADEIATALAEAVDAIETGPGPEGNRALPG